MTIEEIKYLRESEDKVEFKEANNQFAYNNKRRSILGYITALANEGGGKLIFGVKEKDTVPHEIVGSTYFENDEGQLEQNIYRDIQIRVSTEVLHEGTNRVLIIHVPARPVGRLLSFQDVFLMRVGEDLLPMSQDKILTILSEQEPDFSAKVCESLSLSDLNNEAIERMKDAYSRKQNNPSFKTQSIEQTLSDLKLLDNGKLNYAALILLGKKEVIERHLPQAKVIWEYRNSETQIHHDVREVVEEPLFIGIDSIWQLIHQRNAKTPLQSGAFIFDTYTFNEAVIREALLNSIAHRDYSITSEVSIKQFPQKIEIRNPGGFPKGVNLENLLIVSSTPRSRLMTEVLEKTGLVERSGQGIDKIFSITLQEGKDEPDYKDTDLYQVTLKLDGEIKDKAFCFFLEQYKKEPGSTPLGVEQIITLCKVKNGFFNQLKPEFVEQLERVGLITKESGHTTRYRLKESYYQMSNDHRKIGHRYTSIPEIEKILLSVQGNSLKISEFEKVLTGSLTRSQIKYLLQKLIEDEIIQVTGQLKGVRYSLNAEYEELRGDYLINKVVHNLKSKYENAYLIDLALSRKSSD